MTQSELPRRARVVVIGGGVIGCSVAYHLAAMGCRDVLLLERDRLTSGTTWHAAGLMVRFGSTSATSTELREYTHGLYGRLEAETGQATGFRPVGFVELATEPDRLEEYRRVAALNRYLGVDVHEISAAEVAGLFPLARTDDVLAGFYVEDDGRVNPVDVTMALAKGARQGGVTIVEGTPVETVLTRRGPGGLAEVTGVRVLQDGEPVDVEAGTVVNCTGIWARQLAGRTGVTVPLQAAEHYYLITDELPGMTPDLPVIEDPGNYGYYREEGGGLMVGLFEGTAAPWQVGSVPDGFSFGRITPDWDRMAPYVEAAMSRVPSAADVGVRTFFCGPESFTPDLQPVVGEAPEVRNYFVAAGLNSIGILTGGGLGRAVAHWVLTGTPDVDVTGFDVARLHPYQSTPEYRRARTAESLGLVYACHYPTRSPRTARGAKRSPVHDRLVAAGACFRDVSGWEAPDWYAGPGERPDPGPPGWGRAPWFAHWEAEHRAVRERVGLFDLSFMARFRVTGRDAAAVLGRVSAGAVTGEPGRITYTQWLNAAGGIEADLTVTRLDDDDFLVVASDTAHRHALAWLRRHVGDAHAFVTDVTSGQAQLALQGPRSRELLATLTSADLSDAGLGFRAAGEIDLGYARVLCIRITYVGELGYELYIPAEHAVDVHDRLVAAGERFGLAPAGLRALGSLRLEKGYRDYGHDVDNTDSVLEAGLGFAVDLSPGHEFVGREAVLAARRALDAAGTPGAPARRLAQIVVQDPEPLLWHGEVVHRADRPVGYVRSGSYGWTLGGAVGLVMFEPGVHGGAGPVTQDWLDAEPLEVEIAGRRYPVRASLVEGQRSSAAAGRGRR
jgi:glycine cleavage system aminomethyltransferase T/glycine/D-amino acid oxidase-like deaminating enzyme